MVNQNLQNAYPAQYLVYLAKNGIKDDNRLENLELTTNGSHTISHNKGYKDGYFKGLYDGHESRIKQLESRVTQLEAENILLKSEQGAYSG